MWPNVEAALRWIDTYGDRDGDGFVEYHRAHRHRADQSGLEGLGGCDISRRGRLATGPIALCEVQAYVFGAKRHAAMLARRARRRSNGRPARRRSRTLAVEHSKRRSGAIIVGTYVLALDGDKRQCRVVASNAGHALFTGIAAPERARGLRTALMSAACFSGWGIRTVARTAARYNPMSYHNGSVWPHDNALIALGFARYGFKEPVVRVFAGLFDAACHWELRRFPELFCGFARRGTAPTMYPVACSPQAWASATVFGLLQASLGLALDPAAGEIRFDRPTLPAFLRDLNLRGLRFDDAAADVLLHAMAEVTASVPHRQGTMRVVVIH